MTCKVFSEQPQLNRVPRHIAIVMDGNRRWAKRNLSKNLMGGHWAGARVLMDIVQSAANMGVEVLTVYAFSTENWQRTPQEVETLHQIFESYLIENRQKMMDEGVKFETIGNITPFPESLKKEIRSTREATKEGGRITLVVAFNYGGRDDLRRACQKIARSVESGSLHPDAITEEVIASSLDTSEWGDPDLFIRTSGEKRLSNFLVWQLAYSEVYLTDVLWPDFTPDELKKAIDVFQTRERRYGR